MIKHVVLFRFKDDIAAEDRKNAFESFRSGIMSLVKIIPVIRKIEVGYNVNSQESWDICLCGEFESTRRVSYSTSRAPQGVWCIETSAFWQELQIDEVTAS